MNQTMDNMIINKQPLPPDYIDQKLKIIQKVNDNFPFLKDHFKVVPLYNMQGEIISGGWNIQIFNGKNTVDMVLEEASSDLWKEKVEPLLEEIKKLKK